MNNKLLDVENLTMKFGGLVAIDDLTFSASKNQITSIIGPNGAGKTTVFNCLTGFYKATAGSMYLNKEKERLNLRKFSDFKVRTSPWSDDNLYPSSFNSFLAPTPLQSII